MFGLVLPDSSVSAHGSFRSQRGCTINAVEGPPPCDHGSSERFWREAD
jgi:hypothetical protein